MKDIKPFLPLYMGCEAVISHLSQRMIVYGFEEGRTKINGYLIDALEKEDAFTIKPILRKLDSMTEEEMITYLRLKHNAYTGEYKIEWRANGFWWNFLGIGKEKFKFFGEIIDESNADQFQYLLSKHFDLFNLIDQGLALDRSTLTH